MRKGHEELSALGREVPEQDMCFVAILGFEGERA